MKYRRLSKEELEELKEEFIKYLAVNTVTADDWKKIQTEDIARGEDLIDTFSDMVMEKALKNIKYLEHRSDTSLMLFKCEAEEMVLTGINLTKNIGVDFNDPKSVEILISTGTVEDGVLSHFSSIKKYDKAREVEIFDLTNTGCLVVTEEYYTKLTDLLS
jgi:ACT domain-containing protein